MTIEKFTHKVEAGAALEAARINLSRTVALFKRAHVEMDAVIAAKAEYDAALAA